MILGHVKGVSLYIEAMDRRAMPIPYPRPSEYRSGELPVVSLALGGLSAFSSSGTVFLGRWTGMVWGRAFGAWSCGPADGQVALLLRKRRGSNLRLGAVDVGLDFLGVGGHGVLRLASARPSDGQYPGAWFLWFGQHGDGAVLGPVATATVELAGGSRFSSSSQPED